MNIYSVSRTIRLLIGFCLDKGISLDAVKNSDILSDLKYIIESHSEIDKARPDDDMKDSLFNTNNFYSMDSVMNKTKVDEFEIIENFNDEISRLVPKDKADLLNQIIFYEKEGKGQRFCSFCLLIKVFID
jgi:hypothetical protein